MKLKVRCPSCAKLYEVSSEEIQTETPVFQCIACEKRFSFDFPPANFENVLTFLVGEDVSEERSGALSHVDARNSTDESLATQIQKETTKSCPKCGAVNTKKAHECYSCHVLFEKLDGLPLDPLLKAQPSLVRRWKSVLDHFDNLELHEAFIKACVELDAHRFAILKYEEIKAAQGGDALCDQMIAKVNSLMMIQLRQKPLVKEGAEAQYPKWRKWIFISPYALSAFLILWGVLSLGHRNLIGIGVALACMTTGLIIIIRGQISISDFKD